MNTITQKCKHKLNKKKVVNPIFNKIELIKLWNIRTGDYNDVYENKEVKGTESQIDEYLKDYFYPQQMRYIDDFSSFTNFGYQIYYPNGDVKFYAEAIETEYPLSQFKEFVNLVKEDFWN